MREVSEHSVGCPYCGERFTVLVDGSLPEQSYVEDCEVCCRPIVFDVAVAPDGGVGLSARAENE